MMKSVAVERRADVSEEFRVRVPLVAAVAVAVVAAAGCTGSGSGDEETTPSTSSSPVTTAEEGLTAPGTELKMGESATVRYTANAKHDSLIKLRVISVNKGKIKHLKNFDLTRSARRSNVYYVKARVKNVGEGDLGGKPLILYGAVSDKLVVPPVEFESTFNRCDYEPLPKKFEEKHKGATVCLVMLAPKHGKISEVQWRPADNAEPISWLRR